MRTSRTTRSRKLVKLKRKPAPAPARPAPLPDGGRQSRDWIAATSAGAAMPASAASGAVTSKLIAVWAAATLATGTVIALFAAAAYWVYEASSSAPVTPASSMEMPSSPRGSNRHGGASEAGSDVIGNALGGSGTAGRMALIDGKAAAPSGGQVRGAPGQTGRSSTCVVEVDDPAKIEQTLRSCIQTHEGR